MTKDFHYPAAERNKMAIADVLLPRLKQGARVLEIASGTLQHAEYFCAQRADLQWMPTDISAKSIENAKLAAARVEAIAMPIELNVEQAWPDIDADAIYCANMIHIAPWSATEGFFRGAAKQEIENLHLYGPYRFADRVTAPSNDAFDRSLKERNANWGVRDFESVEQVAKSNHYELVDVVDMPANNFFISFVAM